MTIPRRCIVACVLAVLLVLAADAFATPQVFRWTAPADTTDISDYRIRTGRCGSDLNMGFRIVDKAFQSATMDIPADGRLYCAQIVSFGADNSESPVAEFPAVSFPLPNFSLTVSADVNYIPVGSAATVTWSTAGVASCSRWIGIAGVIGAEVPVPTAGSEVVSNITGTMLFVLTCRNPAGAIGVESIAVATFRPIPPPVP